MPRNNHDRSATFIGAYDVTSVFIGLHRSSNRTGLCLSRSNPVERLRRPKSFELGLTLTLLFRRICSVLDSETFGRCGLVGAGGGVGVYPGVGRMSFGAGAVSLAAPVGVGVAWEPRSGAFRRVSFNPLGARPEGQTRVSKCKNGWADTDFCAIQVTPFTLQVAFFSPLAQMWFVPHL